MQLQSAMIFVKDLRRMAQFYGGTLGLKPLVETITGGWAEFEAGNTTLALHAIPPQLADQVEISYPPRVREKNPVKLVFAVEDVEAERSRLDALGVAMIVRPWGACDGVDPEGNVFQITRLTRRIS
jgi:catechol 2,3-dioxygenase-like lactoylglutathione lyase family enzyme